MNRKIKQSKAVLIFVAALNYIWRKIDILLGEHLLQGISNRGHECAIRGHGKITHPDKIVLGDYVSIGSNFFCVASGGVTIDSHSILSRNCIIQTQTHEYESTLLPFGTEMTRKPVTIGKAVWVGMNVSILPGVTIGDGAIIGMNSVVTKSIPAGGIAVGCPAKVIKYRDIEHFNQLIAEDKFLRPELLRTRASG